MPSTEVKPLNTRAQTRRRSRRIVASGLGIAILAGVVGMAACAPDEPEVVVLGPADGLDLPAADLERVQVGQLAPDFTLTSLAGPPVRLSSLRGDKNVVLVFYRGHW